MNNRYTQYNNFGLVVVLFIALISILGLLIFYGGFSFNTLEKSSDVTGKIYGDIKFYGQKSQKLKTIGLGIVQSCEDTLNGAVIRNSTGKYSYKNVCMGNGALQYSCSNVSDGKVVDALVTCLNGCVNGECAGS